MAFYSSATEQKSFNAKHFCYAFSSVATLLLPVHPSVQSFLYHSGIPSFYLSFFFFAPLPLFLLTRFKLKIWHAAVLTPFILYVTWFAIRGVNSDALGGEDFALSAMGVYVLIPLSIICAIVASHYCKYSSMTICIFGLIALLHFVVVHILFSSGQASGFRSLSTMEQDNYQATGFYIGLFGISLVYFLGSKKPLVLTLSAGLLIFVIYVMGLVGARASLIALILTVVLFLFLHGQRKLMSIAIVSLSLLLLYVLFLNGFLSSSFFEKMTVLQRIGALFEGDDSSLRVGLFTQAINMWFDSARNFIIGGGLATYPIFIGANEIGWYPHNFILESLAEGGIIALLIISWILISYNRKIFFTRWNRVSFGHGYAAAVSFYALLSYQFMGGISTLWIPFFYVSYFLLLRVSYAK